MLQPARSNVGAPATLTAHGAASTLRSEEVEHIGRLAIELVVLWGGDTLSVSHFAAPSVVFVGAGSGCGVALPVELLGVERRCVAVASRSDICAVLHGDARGWVTLPDGSTRRFDACAAARRSASQGTAEPDAEVEPPPAAAEPTLGIGAHDLARDAIERRTQIHEARKFGITGLLDWPELKDPTTRFERHVTGVELSMMQQLFNPDSVPLAEGPGGLAPSGIGGGGTARVVALGAVRTIDEGGGGGPEQVPRTLEPEEHSARAPALRQVESIHSDPLAAASIRHALQAERPALRGCHAEAAGSRSLATALVRFVVQGNGQVGEVSATDPGLPADVTRCIERVFLGIIVPNPASRPVRVSYRVALDSYSAFP